jgi:nucleotide-binding universal stress UspA family protein
MAENGAIVVGTDGSEGSRAAVRWATQEAHRRGLALRIVAAGGLDALMPSTASESFWGYLMAHRESWASDVVNEATDVARQTAASVEPQTAVYVRETAVAALQREAESSDLLVLGSHGRSSAFESRLGSTAIALTQVAPCPVVIVRTTAEDPLDAAAAGNVVVGVDGSPSSQRAVDFAFAEAALRGTGLTAIHAWSMPWFRETLSIRHELLTSTRPSLQQDAAALLSQSLAETRKKHPDVPVAEQVVEERPAEALVRASQEAPLLVVGSRGQGGLTGLLLGSVSHAVLHRAQCPVAVVRGVSQETSSGPLD